MFSIELPSRVIVIVLAAIAGAAILWGFLYFILAIILRAAVFRKERSYYRIINIFYEQHFVRTSEGDAVDMWWLPHKSASDVVLYLHGNSGRLPHFFQSLCTDYNVLAPSYPGYGLSEGEPSEKNIYETADLAYQWLLSKGFGEDHIIIWGHSLGGAPAVYLASKHPDCKKLVVINSFSSLRKLSCRRFGFILKPFLKNWFNTAIYAKKVEGKVVQFCYKHDKTIPFEECKLLFNNYKTKDKTLIEMDGPCHEYFDVEATLKT